MKRKTLLIMLLAALFVPLAMNAQTKSFKKGVHSPKLDKLEMNSAEAKVNAQNEMFVKSPVQIPNLESRNFSLENANNAMGSSITRDGVTYELVTTSQSDWSGNYVMAVPFSETVGYGFDGTIDDNTGGITQVTLENTTTMTSIGDAAVLTIAPSTSDASYYTIKINGGDYLADGQSGLETSSTETDYTNWAISLTSDGMQLYNPVWSGGPYYLYFLYFENTSSGGAGAFFLTDDGTSYTSETVEGYEFEYIFPYLYKEVSSGGGNDCDYEKVTASQSDWSGDYVITYVSGTTAYVLTGKNANGNYGAYTTATITNNLLANADVAAYNVTIEPVTYNNQTKYTLKIGNTYLGYTSTSTSGSNYLYFTESIPSSNPQRYYWTIAYSNNTVTLTSVYNTRRVLKWNSSQPRFACYTSGQNAITLFKKLTDCAPACPTPTNLTYSNVTGEGATLAWNGEANSYNILIGPAPKTYDFEDGSLQGWTAYDADGDGESWFASNATSSGNSLSHGGDYFAMAGYNEDAAVDDWLISPQVQLGGSISFWVRRYSTSYTDNYRVYVSTTNTNISSFTEISSGTITPGTSYTQASYPLSSYSGMGYVAIRHTAAKDQAYLFVDDITIVQGGQTIPNVTSPYTVTGLDYATEYVWQVQGDCGDGALSQWSTSSTFTTLDLCAAPTGLSSADATNNSVSLSWTGLADTYDIQYFEYDATQPATLILNVPTDIWSDGTGYQLILDADHSTYGTTIPESGNFTAGTFADFEYTIPENAECNASTSTIVVGSSATITIPAGVYDYVFLNPDPSSGTYYIASDQGFPSRGDDFVFLPGMTYEFTLSLVGQNDNITLATSPAWSTVTGQTSPYTLTGLNPGTTYVWQVQGADCDNWSASAYFTTLAGTLVESITASDVTVLVGETATITPTVLPADATNPAVTYTSGDDAIATVTAGGVVTGVAPGNTTITIAATDGSNVSTTINVTVNGIDVTEITAEDVTVINGQTATISYTVAPNNATDPSVTFTSADVTIATVDATGVVTGVAVGETTITITSVSNPEVTATITVTVTSNPNAVQFTVNTPANAKPGDVITVEAVLAAPTSGNYNGFNALLTGIYYDNTAFEFVANSIVNGPVAQAAQQNGNQAVIMTGTDVPGVVQLTIACWQGYVTAEGVVFSAQFTVLEGAEGDFTFTAKPVEDKEFTNEGVFIPYEFTPSTLEVGEFYTKHIIGYNSEEGNVTGNYYLIASPIGNVAPTAVTNMTIGSYDLYYFDQTQELEWINYEGANGNFDMERGKGYLYANSETVDLIFIGTANTNGEVTLTYSEDNPTDETMYGRNLVGNPFAEDAYIEDGRDFYRMNEDGDEIMTDASNGKIDPMEGVFVYAETDSETLTFTTTKPENQGSKAMLAINLSRNSSVIDRAIVRFGRGRTLPKFQLFENSTKIYIEQDNHEYAVVNSDTEGEMPVNFKASEDGSYNIAVNINDVETHYLHLIDNITGADIDLLQTPSYTFTARSDDYASRFKLVFSASADDDNFAFIGNGDIIITDVDANATLQIVDVTGRILFNENAIHSVSTANLAKGVYVLRLINGSDVKTQKIVIK